MSFFPRSFISGHTDPTFTPLFRLLDDFETYRGTSGPTQGRHQKNLTFSPRFDVKEVAEGYELHGELPGINQKDVEIEFSDAQTLTIRGHSKREYTAGTPPVGIEAPKSSGAITEGGEAAKESHQPTVEDESEANDTGKAISTTSKSGQPDQTPAHPEFKYWVSERSVGEFARSFSFPQRVDQDAVKANMKDGILSIFVPKAKKHESRKITIQ